MVYIIYVCIDKCSVWSINSTFIQPVQDSELHTDAAFFRAGGRGMKAHPVQYSKYRKEICQDKNQLYNYNSK